MPDVAEHLCGLAKNHHSINIPMSGGHDHVGVTNLEDLDPRGPPTHAHQARPPRAFSSYPVIAIVVSLGCSPKV